MKKLIIAFLAVGTSVSAQKKNISLEDIYKSPIFYQHGVYGLESMNDGIHYTTLDDGKILQYDYAKDTKPVLILDQNNLQTPSGKKVVINDYQFAKDENKLLIATETESIYRHSTKENYYIYDRQSKSLTPLSNAGKQMYATFSPDGNKVAFVRDNNMYLFDLVTGKETAITKDGLRNNIINGATDWVHEEEFSFSIAFFWSPDSKKIAYYRFDESKVKEFTFSEYKHQLYPDNYTFKYPKAGEQNSIVTIHVFDLSSGKDQLMDIGSETDQYIPRIKWSLDPNILSIVRMNRHQNKLDLLFNNATTGVSKTVYTENSDTYIDIHESEGDYVYFTEDKQHFIIISERSKFNHLYLYDMSGKLVNPITQGNWDMVSFLGINEKTHTLYYTASETTAIEKDIYSVKLDGTGKTKISTGKGVNDPTFSKGMNYYINHYSDGNTPDFIAIHDGQGKQVRVLEDNAALIKTMKEYNLSKKEFFQFKTTQGIDLNAWMIKPPDFDPNKKYPALLIFYGGPGANLVNNSFDRAYFWHQLLAQKQYVVVCVDNRGTKYRGTDFNRCTYKQMGKLEVEDQIESAKYLGSLPYIDKSRIGCWGWSFGGFLSSLCITKGADYFKAAIAVAPVTNWRYYDNIYTERFMQLPSENPDGYDSNSPINHVSKLKGKYLLIHGSGDDNVHFQNTMEMISAMVAANKQFDLFIYPDKNHGIRGGNTSFHLYTKMTDFILNNL